MRLLCSCKQTLTLDPLSNLNEIHWGLDKMVQQMKMAAAKSEFSPQDPRGRKVLTAANCPFTSTYTHAHTHVIKPNKKRFFKGPHWVSHIHKTLMKEGG